MNRCDTLLFDLDGTLIDSIRLIIESYHHTLSAHGLPAQTDEIWLRGIGTPLRNQLGPFCTESVTIETLIATYREYNILHHDGLVKPYPGVVTMIRAVRARGLRTGLVTSKNRAGALRGLRLAGIEDAFDTLVCADEVENPKPHPEPVLKALTHLQSRPETAVFIGDSVHDMESGRAAGVRTAAVLWGPFRREHLSETRPAWWLERPEDVLDLIV
ncbi:MAG: HAD-IA family hydrolase [Gemmatimonadales bacterium]